MSEPEQLSLFPSCPPPKKRPAKALHALAGATINFKDVKHALDLSVKHYAGIGAVYFFRNKRIIYLPEQFEEYRQWQQRQFDRWVQSHKVIN